MKKNRLTVAICASLCGVTLWADDVARVTNAMGQVELFPYYLLASDVWTGAGPWAS